MAMISVAAIMVVITMVVISAVEISAEVFPSTVEYSNRNSLFRFSGDFGGGGGDFGGGDW